MRTEREMFDLILGVAKADERVRAVYLNGSRANPKVEPDRHQDYDIVYVVTEIASFLKNRNWIKVFGEIAMVQEPYSNDFGWGIDQDSTRFYNWLILFKDGVRIDLGIQTRAAMLEEYGKDSLTSPLLDKDALLPTIPPPDDRDYWTKKPTKEQYAGCCNEFWWCLNNVAKGIVRDQLPYAMRMYHQVVHVELDRMLEWKIGIKTSFSATPGRWGKCFKDYLSPTTFAQYAKTYSGFEGLWGAVFSACDLFASIARDVGVELGYAYNESDEKNMREYLQKMRAGE